MNKFNSAVLLLFAVLILSCNSSTQESGSTAIELSSDTLMIDSSSTATISEPVITAYHDTDIVDASLLIDHLLLDVVYATENNFLKEKVYDCQKCYLRYETALALKKVDDQLKEKGLSVKVFDCLRPFSVQKIMWEVLPDSRYVANPNKKGSIHNRGGAIDLTIVDAEGNDIDMGTEFDHFGVESHHTYTDLDSTTLAYRQLLKEAMEDAGFKSLTTEWWHYTFKSNYNYSIADKIFECE